MLALHDRVRRCALAGSNRADETGTQRAYACSARAENLTQDLYVSPPLKTKRIMAKDEDVCLHCGLCAERCPTGAWDMQKFLLEIAYADGGKKSCKAA